MNNQNEYNQIAKTQIAVFLKSLMKEKGISANKIIKTGLHNSAVYAILQMKGRSSDNYTMDSFLHVCRVIGVHIELHELAERLNWNMLPD